MADNQTLAAPPGDSVAALEAEERLAALDDRAARFAELVAEGHSAEEAYARAGFTDGSAQLLATRHDVVAAVSAIRDRNLGDSPTDVVYLRRLLHGAAYFAFRDQDHRGVTNTVRLLAELDGHLEKRDSRPPDMVNIQINIGAGPPQAARGGGRPVEAEFIEVGGRSIPAGDAALRKVLA